MRTIVYHFEKKAIIKMITSSLNKKPCKDCPYLAKSEPFFVYGMSGNMYDFDGGFVHNCHKLEPIDGRLERTDLGCVGSKQWGEKLKGVPHLHLKKLSDL